MIGVIFLGTVVVVQKEPLDTRLFSLSQTVSLSLFTDYWGLLKEQAAAKGLALLFYDLKGLFCDRLFKFLTENYCVRLFIDLLGQKMVGGNPLNNRALSEQIAVSCSDQVRVVFCSQLLGFNDYMFFDLEHHMSV